MTFAAFHLPGTHAAEHAIVLQRDAVSAHAPRLSPAQLRDICTALRSARGALLQLPVARIAGAIDEAARRLRDPDGADYATLIRGIVAFTGYSQPMAELVLERMSADWLAPSLDRLLHAELGSSAAIDTFVTRESGVRSRVLSPPLTFHVFAGNVPGVSVTSIVRALLVKSAVLGKTAAGEPLLAPRFAQLLQEIDPVVGACVGITYWTGGDVELEAVALEQADTVVHYGSAAAVASLRQRAPAHVRFLEHGPKLSFALINGALTPQHQLQRAAQELARAVALFDQQGCVSPQIAYVVSGDIDDARAFAAHVAEGLARMEHELPRGRLAAGEAAAVHALRTSAEFRSIRGENVELWCGEKLAWTVLLDDQPQPAASCLNRTLLVKHTASLAAVLNGLQPLGALLQTMGVAGFDQEQLLEIASAAAQAGVTRVTSLSDMPWPPVTWHHDGRGPLTELIRWVDLES